MMDIGNYFWRNKHFFLLFFCANSSKTNVIVISFSFESAQNAPNNGKVMDDTAANTRATSASYASGFKAFTENTWITQVIMLKMSTFFTNSDLFIPFDCIE